MPNTHWVATAGLHGCLPNTCEVFQSKKAAVESLAFIHEFSPNGPLARELRRSGSVELNLSKYGNEYAAVEECDCQEPEVHSDSGEPLADEDTIPDYVPHSKYWCVNCGVGTNRKTKMCRSCEQHGCILSTGRTRQPDGSYL